MPTISIILPCRNEAAALPNCLRAINDVIKEQSLDAEIIVSDSSDDESPRIAVAHGARLVKHDQPGYGRACMEGLRSAQGRYLIIMDADMTYDATAVPRLVAALQLGNDVAIGNRFAGVVQAGAMPWLHRFVGSPITSWLLRILCGAHVTDPHCGMRALTSVAYKKMMLRTEGMEFASEMIIRAARARLTISEIPVNYRRRLGHSKLRPLADGVRHVRFIFLFSSWWILALPGIVTSTIGAGMLAGSVIEKSAAPSLALSGAFVFLAGYQLLLFTFFIKVYATVYLGESLALVQALLRWLSIDRIITPSLLLLLSSVPLFLWAWMTASSIAAIWAGVILGIGIQTALSALSLSILGIKER